MLERHEHQHLVGAFGDDLLEDAVAVADVELHCVAGFGVACARRDLQEFAHHHRRVHRRDLRPGHLHDHLVLEAVVVEVLLLGQRHVPLNVEHVR